MDDEHRIPYAKTTLMLGGKAMMEPLSLNDFPAIAELLRSGKTSITLDVAVRSSLFPVGFADACADKSLKGMLPCCSVLYK